MTEPLATFVDVILPLYLPKLYTYRVSADLFNDVQIGKRVVIQFGKTRIFSAIVRSIHHKVPEAYEAKYILSVLDNEPIVNENQLKFWDWIANYYMCTVGDVMAAALPAPFKLQSATKILRNPDFDKHQIELDDKEFLILEALELQEQLSINEVQDILQLKNVFSIIKNLVQKGAVLLNEELKQKYTEKSLTCVKLNSIYDDEEKLKLLFDKLEKKEKQLNLLLSYLHLKNEHKHVDKQLLLKSATGNLSSLSTLVKNKIFDLYEISVDRIQIENTPLHEFELNPTQKIAFESVKNNFNEKDVVLLHGVTSSGKTHIYVKLIEEALAKDKQVLYLLPEIALTSQVVHRIRKYFGNKCIAFHSKFSDNERVEIWNKVKNNQFKIVIGARSSVFLPFDNLGLVIVDEEHESSFKQNEPAPRYHARDAAIILASMYNCKTILGTATPSFETYFNAKIGKYALVEMKQRFAEMEMPEINTANISEEKRTKTISGNFTSVLYDAIKLALSKDEQIILFQNRRGYAPLIECDVCNWIPRCQNCDISLTYHKFIDSLKCHYCGFTQNIPKSCHACGSHQLTLKGFGTEKIEDELQLLFPESRVGRLDLDAARTKFGHEQIIKDFEQHKFDILVGTQMLSKGLDFEKVNLVGIINADQLLYFPDFRANERAFQLILQVSGRGGRKHKRGKVVIQTSSPDHPVIHSIIENDYEGLYLREMQERQRFAYPPFYRLIKICIKHKDVKVAENAAYHLRNMLAPTIKENLLGPESPYVSKIRNYFIKELLVKVERTNTRLPTIKNFIKQHMQKLLEMKEFKNAIVFADVDVV